MTDTTLRYYFFIQNKLCSLLPSPPQAGHKGLGARGCLPLGRGAPPQDVRHWHPPTLPSAASWGGGLAAVQPTAAAAAVVPPAATQSSVRGAASSSLPRGSSSSSSSSACCRC